MHVLLIKLHRFIDYFMHSIPKCTSNCTANNKKKIYTFTAYITLH